MTDEDRRTKAVENLSSEADIDLPAFLRKTVRPGTKLPDNQWERDPVETVSTPQKVGILAVQPLPWEMFIWQVNYPTKQGWYWNRARRNGLEHRTQGDAALSPTCVFIFEANRRFFMLAPDGKHQRDIRTFPEQEWAGPIPEPVEV